MLFNSINFLIFFPIVVLIYFVLPAKVKNYWLLVASYYFYMCWNPKYILLLFSSTVVTYAGSICIDRAGTAKLKKVALCTSIVINIGLLFYFKYINFAVDILKSIFGVIGVTISIPRFDIVLPVGISFFVFQALSYTIDVYRGDIYAEKNFFRYALYVSFFPQLVAGPIERSKNLLVQLSHPGRFKYKRVRKGLLMMLWGYFLKLVMADRVALLVNTVYGAPTEYNATQLALASALFALQIYGDFGGYSMIAIGAAKVLGFNLMENFHMPYLAVSVKDFWRRWHISLSSWFRDYVYIPLGGNRAGAFKKWRNILITFLVSGLWHGANITFVLWGLLHGIYQIIEDFVGMLLDKCNFEPQGKVLASVTRVIKTAWTFVWVDIAWIFFRADTVTDAWGIVSKIFVPSNWHILSSGELYGLGMSRADFLFLFIALFVIIIAGIMRECGIVVIKWLSNRIFVFRYIVYWMAMIMIILSLGIGGQEFIYFQF